MIRNLFNREFVLFLITGGIAATVNFVSRIIYNYWVGFSLAVVLAYVTGMVTAYLLAKQFVFTKSRQSARRSVLFFTLVNLVAVAQTYLISIWLAYHLLPAIGVNTFAKEIAHAIGVIVPVVTSYIGHKRFSFKE